MSKQDERRRTLLAPMGDHILRHGLAAASLRALAEAAGTSDRMLLYYFGDKDALLTATLGAIGEQLAQTLDAAIPAEARRPFGALLREVWAVVEQPAQARYMALWLEAAARAANGEALFAQVGGAIAGAFRAWVADRLDTADETDRLAQATLLLAAVDGMAMLRIVGHDGDLGRALASLGA